MLTYTPLLIIHTYFTHINIDTKEVNNVILLDCTKVMGSMENVRSLDRTRKLSVWSFCALPVYVWVQKHAC